MDTYSGGENLKAEYLSSYQLTFAYRHQPFHADIECNFFYNRASHFLFTQPETRVYENAGSLDMGGIEIVTRYKTGRIDANAHFCYQKVLKYAYFFVTDGYVNNVPDFSANAVAGYFWIKEQKQTFSTYLNFHYSNGCYTQVSVLENGINEKAVNHTLHLSGYAVFSATARYKYKNLEGSININNFLNQKYEYGGAMLPIRQKSRWISGKIMYNF